MLETVLPYLVTVLLLGAMLTLPLRHRPAAGLAAAFILLLLEPLHDASGQRLAGPSTALAVLILLGVGVAFFDGHWRDLHQR